MVEADAGRLGRAPAGRVLLLEVLAIRRGETPVNELIGLESASLGGKFTRRWARFRRRNSASSVSKAAQTFRTVFASHQAATGEDREPVRGGEGQVRGQHGDTVPASADVEFQCP
jgi:hypothetical protein